jgi:hypothetical protein
VKARERTLGKLISLQRAREEAAREALAHAADAAAQAADAERSAEASAQGARATVAQAERAPLADRPLAEVLQFQSRFVRSMRRVAIAAELHRARVRGERITVEEAEARCRITWERARRARERFEEQERSRRREARRAREQREEAEGDDRPARPEDGGREPWSP